MPERDGDALLTIEEAVEEFRISRQTLYRAAEAGELTFVRRPRGRPRTFVRRADVRHLLEPRPDRKRPKKK